MTRAKSVGPLLGLLVVLLIPASGHAAASCDGKPATIVGTAGADVIQGTPGDDVIVGGGGFDQIHAGAGNDTVCVETGNCVYGDEGNDVLLSSKEGCAFGGPGDDRIIGFLGASGEDGNDTLTPGSAYDPNSWVEYDGGAGNDLLVGTSSTNEAADARDRLVGGDGDDTLLGHGSRDFLYPGLGNDVVDGGSGDDVLSYTDVNFPLTIDLAHGRADATVNGHDLPVLHTEISHIEDVDATNFGDVIIGTDSANDINGCGGVDHIEGRAGDDSLIAFDVSSYGEVCDEQDPIVTDPSNALLPDVIDGGPGHDWCRNRQPNDDVSCEEET